MEALGREHRGSRPGLFERNVEGTAATDVAVLAATSGTTGKPKLAMLTHGNLLSAARGLQQVDPMTPEDELLSFLPPGPARAGGDRPDGGERCGLGPPARARGGRRLRHRRAPQLPDRRLARRAQRGLNGRALPERPRRPGKP